MADELQKKPLVWLHGEIKTPPISLDARRTAGFLLRLVQGGSMLSMPHSRPMPSIGSACHELRIRDPEAGLTWRVIYRIDADAILICDVFAKKTQATPMNIIKACQKRLNQYDRASERDAK